LVRRNCEQHLRTGEAVPPEQRHHDQRRHQRTGNPPHRDSILLHFPTTAAPRETAPWRGALWARLGVERCASIGAATVRSCKEIAETAGLTDESVCPTLVRRGWCSCGAGAFACQPIFLQLLRERFLRAPAADREVLGYHSPR
jgi:hypothetical protein